MNRGFTMLETLLSLVLLSVVGLGIASLTRSAASTLPEATAGIAWQAAAEATMREIGRAIESRDRDSRIERVVTRDSSSLRVVGADGNVTGFRIENGTLARERGGIERVLLGELESFEAEIDPKAGTVRVEVAPVDGDGITRLWGLRP